MKLASPGAPHLTYCTNIHAGESWSEVRANLERYVLAVRARVAPERRFGIGLRLSGAAADTLATSSEALAELRGFLAGHDCYVFSINGFPFGAFHGTRVKERVYDPDWREDARMAYSDRLATLLAGLLPADVAYGSVSTVPGAFRARGSSDAEHAEIADRLLRHVAQLVALRARTGRRIRTALEPEPWCVLETVEDAIGFFRTRLYTTAAEERLAALTGGTRASAAAAIRDHLGICFDACHMAIEFEDPDDALARLAAAEIAVVKVQISAGMVATVGGDDAVTRAALAGFADDVYLHQVVERGADGIRRFLDLPAALAAGVTEDRREWRVHFHVPLFREALGPVRSTQPWVAALLRALHDRAYDGHLEVETYTWDVLPESFRGEPVEAAVARELVWVLEQLER